MFEQKKLMDVLLFDCNFSLSAHIQHFETAAADVSSCFRRHTSTRRNLLQHSLTKTGGLFIIRVLQFWHQQQIDSTWNWDLCVFCKQPCKIFCIHDKIWEPYFLSKHPWVPGYFLGPGMLSKQEIPVGEGWAGLTNSGRLCVPVSISRPAPTN